MKSHFLKPLCSAGESVKVLKSLLAFAVVSLFLSVPNASFATEKHIQSAKKNGLSDRSLLKSLPGFESKFAEVNGIKLHYVIGGQGAPLVLLPGWPETWWTYHKMMPALAKHYKVIVVDMRGMGTSSKPEGGYDKKTMATDIHALALHLGYESVRIAGHDIGSQVAYSYAANFPKETERLVMMDVAHPDDNYLKIPMLPTQGGFSDKIDPDRPYLWWFAFHQVKGLPEKMLAGRVHLEHDWFFTYMSLNEASISRRDRAVYARAYNSADAIRASNGWYQAFMQDVVDDRTYAKLTMPVLGIGGPGYPRLKSTMEAKSENFTPMLVPNSGHFIQEEQPEFVVEAMINFLK